MKLLPYDRFLLRSDDPPEVVAGRLAAAVTPRRFFLFTRPPEPFGGRIEGRRFKVLRLHQTFLGMPARNSFQAVILGEIVPHAGGSEVRVSVRLHHFVALFLAIWFGGISFGAALSLWRGAPGVLVGAVAIATFGYLLTNVSFWADVKLVRVVLCQRLGCREVGQGVAPTAPLAPGHPSSR